MPWQLDDNVTLIDTFISQIKHYFYLNNRNTSDFMKYSLLILKYIHQHNRDLKCIICNSIQGHKDYFNSLQYNHIVFYAKDVLTIYENGCNIICIVLLNRTKWNLAGLYLYNLLNFENINTLRKILSKLHTYQVPHFEVQFQLISLVRRYQIVFTTNIIFS